MISATQVEKYFRKPAVRNWLEVFIAFVAMRVYIGLLGLIFSIPLLAQWTYDRQPRTLIVTFVSIVPMIFLFLSIASGWWGLSLTYKTKRPQPANRRTGSASFRYAFSYNNVLKLGSDSEGIYIASWVRLFHPPLFIPWLDIEVGEPKRMLFQEYRMFVLGPANRVPFSIDAKMTIRLLAERDGPKIEEGRRSRDSSSV